jgi:hypothetical protein
LCKQQVLGSSGGIGRHAGLKILSEATPVRVRFPPRVQKSDKKLSLFL